VDDASRSGGVGEEWATLSYATSRVTTPGSLIYVNAGTYYETSQSNLSAGVSIDGAGRTSCILSATTSLSYFVYAASSAGTNGNNQFLM